MILIVATFKLSLITTIQLYLISNNIQLDYMKWLSKGEYYLNKKRRYRQLKTMFGKIYFYRYYLSARKRGEGIYGLDNELVILRDGFSPQVIKNITN